MNIINLGLPLELARRGCLGSWLFWTRRIIRYLGGRQLHASF